MSCEELQDWSDQAVAVLRFMRGAKQLLRYASVSDQVEQLVADFDRLEARSRVQQQRLAGAPDDE